ncbi:glycoside hydrolase family 43 protein [Zopfia rhizophila CBS 207.26]|uniref:Glycoside hydrolase family 43 protein n=1 Tax=Zopfia rhizophila CBS 207.26 TaxID=1314779 RepID=A0A6A6DJQ2_9PEZI|nr:glycoside hydrolase family 43 protein [Zopfia rhizophila CBS 207.26]
MSSTALNTKAAPSYCQYQWMFCTAFSTLVLHALATLAQPRGTTFQSIGNPILADGSYYSADPAPLVVNNTLYILAGRDEAPPDQNNFIMNEWQMFVSASPNPTGGQWTHYPGIARPNSVFAWALQGTAYAAQIVQGRNGKFYLYAPVTEANSRNSDRFAIGVAVADSPLGPYKDAHPSGPILSQSVPAPGNNIQNIDPTVFVDDDGKAYVYYGTFGQLRGYELASDMATTVGSVTTVSSLTGFFEAPWIMKRGSTYYMLYAANNAGPNSPCTPTSSHACIAYGTASSPRGPWTFRGVILGIVSSTTSHSGAVEVNGQWYLVYHTADAQGGGHFRRSVAFDELRWDDTQSPPHINRITQTKRAQPNPVPTRNIAPKASASSVNTTPIQYWVKSLNDNRVPTNPLPPDYWCSYDGNNSPKMSTLVYTWDSAVTLNGTRMTFFADQPAGSNIGVPPPASWYVEYLNAVGTWEKVANTIAYPVAVTNSPREVPFKQISTKSIRAVLTASGSGNQFGGVGVKEWEALAPTAQ